MKATSTFTRKGPRKPLSFKTPPNYEAPTDANGDNVYKVIVVADDTKGGRSERPVSITVTNVAETGKVTLMPEQPRVGTPVTAEVM